MQITSERLAYWFLRLNGFMTTCNFVVHPERADANDHYPQQTEVDVLAVRFPYRIENRVRPMVDHPSVVDDLAIQLVLAETKTGVCSLNQSWTEPERENYQKILGAAGVVPKEQIEVAAAALYANGEWTGAGIRVRLFCFGKRASRTLSQRFPGIAQISWRDQVLPFVFERFSGHIEEKRLHAQWDDDARALFRAMIGTNGTPDALEAAVEVISPHVGPEFTAPARRAARHVADLLCTEEDSLDHAAHQASPCKA